MKRIALGLFEGGLVGALASAVLARVHAEWTPAVAYLVVAAVGALVGAVAGRPFWAREAKLEAGLKSLAGAIIAVIALYGARKWLAGIHVSLEMLGGGRGALGDVPAAVLPAIGAGLGLVFEIDDAFGSEDKGPGSRVAQAEPRARVPSDAEDENEDDLDAEGRARRRE